VLRSGPARDRVGLEHPAVDARRRPALRAVGADPPAASSSGSPAGRPAPKYRCTDASSSIVLSTSNDAIIGLRSKPAKRPATCASRTRSSSIGVTVTSPTSSRGATFSES
jgi:hypothetical protein